MAPVESHHRCGRNWSLALKTIADPPERDRWARMRFLIIGPLMAAPPAPRQLGAALLALAAKTWRHPVSGLDVRFGASMRISAIVDARFSLIVDGETASSRTRWGGAQVPGRNVSQPSTISLKRPSTRVVPGLVLGLD